MTITKRRCIRGSAGVLVTLAVAALSEGPAVASGGGGGGGGTCVVTSSQSYPIPTTAARYPAEDAGSVVLRPVATGLRVGQVARAAGWSASVEVAVGPWVEVQFRKGTVTKKFSGGGTVAYYGSLLVEVKTCG